MDVYQFYPTPLSLGQKLCSFFEETPTRVLEPSAGNGDLIRAICKRFWQLRKEQIDVYEIDPSRHEALRKKATIIGLDFLESVDLSLYSHILMNPPFRVGVQHVLHAWKKLFSGEIAAILNASGVRDPRTADEKKLAEIIQENGRVEYVTEAFQSPDTLRKTSVEVALVYLKKKKSVEFWEGDILQGLDADDTQFSKQFAPSPQGIAINIGQIPALVRAFHAAWASRKESIIANYRASHYESFFSQEMRKVLGEDEQTKHQPIPQKPIHEAMHEAYKLLRHDAWMSVLNTPEFRKMFTRKAQEEILANFQEIEKMSFSVSNIYGFLQGFSLKRGDLQTQMVCDLFDQITYANSENCLFYRWKSNERHRVGMALQRKRFILSGFGLDGWRSSISYEAFRKLEEIDRIFAMVDGKVEPDISLVSLFQNHFLALRNGSRLSSSYFDIRYYRGIGTIHFYPKDQRLIDRINAIVGQYRRWMPEGFSTCGANEKAIEKAYKGAEAVSEMVRKKIDRWTLHAIACSLKEEKQIALERLAAAMDLVEAQGMDTNFLASIGQIQEPETRKKETFLLLEETA